jgi:hypothetical protein
LQDSVDQSPSLGLGNTDTLQDLSFMKTSGSVWLVVPKKNSRSPTHIVEVVRNETVTRPLREEGDGENDPHSLLVSLASEEGQPSRTMLGLTLDHDSGLALVKLELSQRILVVTGTVISNEESEGLFFLAIVDAPSRGFGDEPDQDDLNDRGKTLEERRDTP